MIVHCCSDVAYSIHATSVTFVIVDLCADTESTVSPLCPRRCDVRAAVGCSRAIADPKVMTAITTVKVAPLSSVSAAQSLLTTLPGTYRPSRTREPKHIHVGRVHGHGLLGQF